MSIRTLLSTIAALALAACATGPDYAPKPVSATAAAPFLNQQGPALSSAQPNENWWRLYQDPVLNGLVTDALAANTDVRTAVARLAKARALLSETRGSREPQVGVGGSAQYGKLPGPDLGQDRTDVQVDVGLDVAYEVDLF